MTAERGIGDNIGGIAGEALQGYVDRIERLNEEKAALQADIKQVFGEAVATGFDRKVMQRIIALRKIEEHDYREQEELTALYGRALGMSIFD